MLLTIGHSNLSAVDFRAALDAAGVRTVIDVRSHPTSRHAHFRREELAEWLVGRYEWWPALSGWAARHLPYAAQFAPLGVDIPAYASGRFPKQRIGVARTEQGGWGNQGLFDYQFFMTLNEFSDALDALLARAAHDDVALCCAEAVWWRCHRSMIADAAGWRGAPVRHIMYRFRTTLRPRCVIKLTDHADFVKNRLVAYDPAVIDAWAGRVRVG